MFTNVLVPNFHLWLMEQSSTIHQWRRLVPRVLLSSPLTKSPSSTFLKLFTSKAVAQILLLPNREIWFSIMQCMKQRERPRLTIYFTSAAHFNAVRQKINDLSYQVGRMVKTSKLRLSGEWIKFPETAASASRHLVTCSPEPTWRLCRETKTI